MGNRSSSRETPFLTSYGTNYNSYGNYGNIENYGTVYQSYEQEYTYVYVPTNERISTNIDSPLAPYGQQGLWEYGRRYPTGLLPNFQPRSNRSKVRYIFMPDNIVYLFQNLLQQQQYAFGAVNPMISGVANMGAFGFSQMNPLMPLIQPGFPQIGSNYWSLPPQWPSTASSMPFIFPSPPPMIQPLLPQMSMSYGPMMPQIPSQQPMAYPWVVPQIPVAGPSIPVPSIIPQVPGFVSSLLPCPSAFSSISNVPPLMPYPSVMPQIQFSPPSPIIQQPMPISFPPPLPPIVPQQLGCLPPLPILPQPQIWPQSFPGSSSGLSFYGGFNQGYPQFGSINSYGGLPSIGPNILASPSYVSQPGFIYPGLSGYGGYIQPGVPGYGGYVQPGTSGYSGYYQPGMPGCGGFIQPGYSGYVQSGTPGYSGYAHPGTSGYSGYYQPGMPGYGGFIQPGYSGYYQPGMPGYGGFIQPGYGGYVQSGTPGYNGCYQPGMPGYGGFGPSPYINYSQTGVYPVSPVGYGNFVQSPYGNWSQPGYTGFSQQSYGNLCQPGFVGFNQQPYPNYGPYGYSANGYTSFSPQGPSSFVQQPFANCYPSLCCIFPQVPSQLISTYPQQLQNNASPQQPVYNNPTTNTNSPNTVPPLNVQYRPGAVPSTNNVSPGNPTQLGLLPGGSGRVTIVCCAIPQ